MKNDVGEMLLSEDSKQKAWLEHYQRFLNVGFDWDTDYMSDEPPMEGPQSQSPLIWLRGLSQMKAGKALGPSGIVVGIVVEMI